MTSPTDQRWRRRLLISLMAVLVLSGIFFFWPRPNPEVVDAEHLAIARAALKKKQFSSAIENAEQIAESSSLYADACLVAGEASTLLKDLDGAVRYYDRIAEQETETGRTARFALANVLIHTGDASRAIQLFERVLAEEPNDVSSHSRLAFLYAVCGRRWDSKPHLELIMKSGGATVEELALLADLQRPVDDEEYLQRCHKRFPDDVNVRLGLTAIRLIRGEQEAALQELKDITKIQPKLLSAQSLLGELLAPLPGLDFEVWDQQLPEGAEEWPDIWYCRGLRCAYLENREMAAKCFWRTLQLAPMHRRATYQLGRVLTELKHPEASSFSDQARELFSLTTWLMHATRSGGQNEVAMQNIVAHMDRLGRVWETCAWAQLSRQLIPTSAWADDYLRRLAPQLNRDLPIVTNAFDLGRKVDLSAFPDYLRQSTGTSPREGSMTRTASPLSFVETNVGLDLVYWNAADPQTKGARMQEQTGGGVAVFELDSDGLPDVYCVQGSDWPTGSASPQKSSRFRDGVFRNDSGQAFRNVTEVTGIAEEGFGQSCSAGDLNEDGFDDLYVANIGDNSLWLSNGDGTFSSAPLPDERPLNWTSSCAIVDVNRDSLADLIEINYVSGNEVYSRICSGRACSPSTFEGTVPRIHVSLGDGTFRTVEASVPVKESKGLGVLVFRNADNSLPQIFVANDQTPKFLLTAEGTGDQLAFVDTAFQTGLAYNGDGLLTAAMGIAADDVDQNGLTDFFVTNFMDEANTLYLQQSAGLFQDRSRPAGLDASGLPYVGWGTQFIDAENDGDSDLIMINGHVDDYTDEEGGRFKMPPQLFRNRGDVQFEAVPSAEAGTFLDHLWLGRGLTLVDWNADGRQDFILANIADPVSLITNQTASPGHFVRLRLMGNGSERSAWLSEAEVSAGGSKTKRQLFAGSGYHASNERCLHFGLGSSSRIDSIQIEWPSGRTSRLEGVDADCTLEIREGFPTAVRRDEAGLSVLAVQNADAAASAGNGAP